jgi:hypothetical protein
MAVDSRILIRRARFGTSSAARRLWSWPCRLSRHVYRWVFPHLPGILRSLFALLAVAALAAGYYGYGTMPKPGSTARYDQLDRVHLSLQLFVLNSLPVNGPFSPWLEFARFAAPAATGYVVVTALLNAVTARFRRWWLRWLAPSGHIVVTGDGTAAITLARRIRATGKSIVLVTGDASEQRREQARQGQVLLVPGDPRSENLLRHVGTHRAAALFAWGDDPFANTAVVETSERLAARRRRRLPLALHAVLDDSGIAAEQRVRRVGRHVTEPSVADFVTVDDMGIRGLAIRLLRDRLTAGAPVPRIVVLLLDPSVSAAGSALVLDLAHRWRTRCWREQPGVCRLPVVLVGAGAPALHAQLTRHSPRVAEICLLTPLAETDTEKINGDILAGAADELQIAVVFGADASAALRTALRLRGTRLSTLVYSAHHSVAADPPGSAAAGSANVSVFSPVDAMTDPEVAEEDIMERLARTIHDDYVDDQLKGGKSMSSQPAIRPWEDLPPFYRRSNRAQAAHIGVKLREIGQRLEVATGVIASPFTFAADDDRVERLAELEHDRWCKFLRSECWRRGDRRDDLARIHPALLPWAELDAANRGYARSIVRALPAQITNTGFRVTAL